MKTGFQKSFQRLFRVFLDERRCYSCSRVFLPGESGAFFCSDCESAMPRRKLGFCPKCGELAAWPELPVVSCERCLKEPPPWQAFAFHGVYEGTLRRLLIDLKFNERVVLGHALGNLLARHPLFNSFSADMVVPVPLHPKRLSERGYNQALELSRPLAKRLRAPLAPHALVRTRATPPQTGSNREDRKKNILHAFSATEYLKGKHILLVDDTFTTGATLTEAAMALIDSDAASVSVSVVSRTPKHALWLRA